MSGARDDSRQHSAVGAGRLLGHAVAGFGQMVVGTTRGIEGGRVILSSSPLFCSIMRVGSRRRVSWMSRWSGAATSTRS